MTGSFLGFQDFNDQLFLCGASNNEVNNFLKIGSNYKKTCSYDITQLFNNNNLPKYANLFFDLYLVDQNGNLFNVPVYI
ncbi:MAG: hypothetical protein RLZZ196_3460 [Bacteroidota bacterium]